MDDLISRQAAIEALNKLDVSDGVGISSIACCVQESAISVIQYLPSAQPERKKGKWINDRDLYKCSCCNQLWNVWWAGVVPIEQMKKEMPYCPKCGADMRGE